MKSKRISVPDVSTPKNEELLEEISFYASDYDAEVFNIDEKYVESVFKFGDQNEACQVLFIKSLDLFHRLC